MDAIEPICRRVRCKNLKVEKREHSTLDNNPSEYSNDNTTRQMGKPTVSPTPTTIVSRFAPVLAARPAFCVVDRPAHFFSSPRESVICCRCRSACLAGCEENGRCGRAKIGRRLAVRRRARRAGEADILVAVTCGGG